MATPIWQTTTINFGSDDSYKFRIRVDSASGEIIYNGVAYKRPGESQTTININEICVDYMPVESIPIFTNYRTTPLAWSRYFYVEKFDTSTSSWVSVQSVEFSNNWSYDSRYNIVYGLSFPITRVSRYQPIMWSWTNMPSTLHCRYTLPGSSRWYNKNISVANTGKQTIAIFPQQYQSGIDRLQIDESGVATTTYQIIDTCARFALYYVNIYGGWDTFLFEGNYTQAHNLNRITRVSPDGMMTRKYNYLNEIVDSVTLNTGLLTDYQAESMGQLLNSTNVWLYDLQTGFYYRAVVTDTSWEEKTYKNQGRLFNYTIKVEYATGTIRR